MRLALAFTLATLFPWLPWPIPAELMPTVVTTTTFTAVTTATN